MNILEAEDMVKGLPDQVLFQYAQNPPPTIPQFLAISEVQRRQDMRQRFQAQQQEQKGTVKDQILQGIGGTGMAPEMSSPPPMAPEMPPQGPPMGPPQGPPMGPEGAPVMAYRGGMMPYRMADGGAAPGAPTGRYFGGFGPEVADGPDRLQRTFGSTVKPSMLPYSDPNVGRLFKMLKDNPEQIPDSVYEQMYANPTRGLRAPASGGYGGGSGGEIGYGGPTTYFNPSSFTSMDRKKPTVTVEEIPEAGMYGGGQIPYRMSQGRQTPTESEIREALSTPPRNRTPRQTEIVRAALSSSERNPVTSRLYSAMYGNPQMPGAEPPAAPRPAAAPARPPAVEAGIPAAGAALTSNAPPAAPPVAPAAPPMAPAVAPPVTPPAGFIAPDTAGSMFDDMMKSARISEAPAPISDRQARVDEMMTGLPGIVGQIQGLMPPPQSFSMQDLERFAPKPFDDSATMARREALINQLQEAGRTRRAEDIAAAERYRSEAEMPIQSAQEEARKTAIASTLMRLGAGLAAGKPAEGLASASEAVESIMTRAREQATAERRAVRQEFRQAEREATRGERDMANTVFQMQAQQITSDENKQRELARDQMQFSQWAFGQMRDQGKDQRQAYESSIRLGAGLLQAVDSAIREEIKNKRISQDQYTSTVGSLVKSTTDLVKQYLPTDLDITTPEGQKTVNDTVKSIVDAQVKNFNIRSPEESGAGSQSNMRVNSFEEISPTSLKVNGQTINFKTEEQANAFKKSIGR